MTGYRPRWALWAASLALLAILFLGIFPDVGWARAGGGGGYGGGGGGGGGSGGGGDGGGLIWLLIWLCMEYPAIGIPVTILVVAGMIFGGKSANEGRISRTIRRENQYQQQHLLEGVLTALRNRDPEFDEQRFLARVDSAFLKIQDAWSRQDLSSVRAFISDGIHERFSLQVEMQRAEGYRNLMDDVSVLGSQIVAVYSDERFDTIHVCIRASAVDYNVDAKSGRRTSGSIHPEEFVEYWSFHRRRGAETTRRPGSIEGNCPSCGDVLQVVDRAQCPSCGSTVNSGEHDWVLAEISQAQEWRLPDAGQRVSGLAQLQQADAGFSVQHIEDRASVMFYRLKAAAFYGDEDYAAPILSQSGDGIPSLERMPAGEFWKDPAIGKVETLDVDIGGPDDFDRVRVMVRWSGTRLRGKPGARCEIVRRQAIYSHVYVLARAHGVNSLPSQTFASSSCSECGAPIAASKEPACQFCGTSLVDGRHDWVLENILPFTHDLAFRTESPEAEQPLPAENGRDDSRPFVRGDAELSLAVLSRVVLSDGQVHEKEKRSLIKLGRRWSLSNEQIQAAFESGKNGDDSIPVPADRGEALGYLEQLIRISLADGRLSSQETRLLYDYGERMNYSKADVRHTIARERKEMYQQARALQRERRGNGRGASV